MADEDSVLQMLVGEPRDPEVEEVLYIAVGVELNRHGLSSKRSRSADVTELSDLARQSGVAYVLVTHYRIGDRRITGKLELYTADADLLSERSFAVPISIDLDRDVSAEVSGFLGAMDGDEEGADPISKIGEPGSLPRATSPVSPP